MAREFASDELPAIAHASPLGSSATPTSDTGSEPTALTGTSLAHVPPVSFNVSASPPTATPVTLEPDLRSAIARIDLHVMFFSHSEYLRHTSSPGLRRS